LGSENRVIIGNREFNSVLVARIDQVRPGNVGNRSVENLLERLHLQDDSPAAIARLNRNVHRPAHQLSGAIKQISRIVFARGRLHAQAQGNISVRMAARVQQAKRCRPTGYPLKPPVVAVRSFNSFSTDDVLWA